MTPLSFLNSWVKISSYNPYDEGKKGCWWPYSSSSIISIGLFILKGRPLSVFFISRIRWWCKISKSSEEVSTGSSSSINPSPDTDALLRESALRRQSQWWMCFLVWFRLQNKNKPIDYASHKIFTKMELMLYKCQTKEPTTTSHSTLPQCWYITYLPCFGSNFTLLSCAHKKTLSYKFTSSLLDCQGLKWAFL